MSIGVVIGKFNPFHLGHDHLICTAKDACTKVFVIVCERPDQTLPGELRASWIRREHPDVDVLVTHDDLPDEAVPWARRTLELIAPARPDVVFTSESYGDDYAELMGSVHRSVDPERLSFPVSGSQIRADLGAHWGMLTPPAKAHLTMRVVVTGVESSGTTTLAEDLARHLETVWVPEYGRWYWEGRRHLQDQSWDTGEFVAIARAQNALEDALARKANRVLICDTDALTTHVWHRRYIGEWSAEVQEITASRQPDVYLLTTPDFPFVQDGTREGEEIRLEMHDWFVELLGRMHRPYVELSGSREVRLREALRIIETLPTRSLV